MPHGVAKKHAPINPSNFKTLRQYRQSTGILSGLKVCDYTNAAVPCKDLTSIKLYQSQVNSAPCDGTTSQLPYPWQHTCWDFPPWASGSFAAPQSLQTVLKLPNGKWLAVDDSAQPPCTFPPNVTVVSLDHFRDICESYYNYENTPAPSTGLSQAQAIGLTIGLGLFGVLLLVAWLVCVCYLKFKDSKKPKEFPAVSYGSLNRSQTLGE